MTGSAISLPREALIGAKNARITLLAGFTTIRNVGADGFSDIALRDAINAGDVPGPRIDASGPALSITGGHCDDNLLALRVACHRNRRGRWRGECATQGARDHQVRRRCHQGVRHRWRAVAGRQSAGVAVHPGRVACHHRRRSSPGAEGGRPCSRRAGNPLGYASRSRFHRARLVH